MELFEVEKFFLNDLVEVPPQQISHIAKDHAAQWLQSKLGFQPQVSNSTSGRPIIDEPSFDISISHKPPWIFCGYAKRPHRIGLDVENLKENISGENFEDYIVNNFELELVKKSSNTYDKNQLMIIVFSIKESICKSLDVAFSPLRLHMTEFQFSSSKRGSATTEVGEKVVQSSFTIEDDHVWSSTVHC